MSPRSFCVELDDLELGDEEIGHGQGRPVQREAFIHVDAMAHLEDADQDIDVRLFAMKEQAPMTVQGVEALFGRYPCDARSAAIGRFVPAGTMRSMSLIAPRSAGCKQGGIMLEHGQPADKPRRNSILRREIDKPNSLAQQREVALAMRRQRHGGHTHDVAARTRGGAS